MSVLLPPTKSQVHELDAVTGKRWKTMNTSYSESEDTIQYGKSTAKNDGLNLNLAHHDG